MRKGDGEVKKDGYVRIKAETLRTMIALIITFSIVNKVTWFETLPWWQDSLGYMAAFILFGVAIYAVVDRIWAFAAKRGWITVIKDEEESAS